ncbi:hypothetical protein [Streptomyces somaliensis]|uniref:hypothetical protein n=1 Tax=Streptomyces somaliensis TaxID=78355 RepID=UPI00029A03C4|nr:hypothetical protein [Streptomyces somaliensis]
MSEDSRGRGPRAPRRRRGARWAAVAAAVAVVAGGAFWLSGGYGIRGGGSALDGACEGDLAAGPVRALLPDAALTASSELRQDGWRCSVSAPGGEAGVEVRIRNAGEPLGPGASADPGPVAVPLGGGWTGSFAYGDDTDAARGRAVLLLDCGDESGDGLLAVADGRLADGASFEDGAARTRLVSALADTARSYARRTGCGTGRDAEGTVEDVAAPVVDARRPLSRASGTCRGVVDAATARRWGAGTVAETPARPAPVERCVLGSGLGTPLYTFTASYGPYGETALSDGGALPANGAAESPSGRYRLTAKCPGADGTGVYEIVPDDGLALDHASLRGALKSFAASSAALHRCGPPA